MLDETIKFTKKLNKMEDINEKDNWWNYLQKYIVNFIEIITKEERLIYTGITILIISLLLYLIDSSS